MKFKLNKKETKEITIIRRRFKYVFVFTVAMIIIITMLLMVFKFFVYLLNSIINLKLPL